MGRLLYTKNIGFDMGDWEKLSIKKVFAGTGCIMAVTEDGRTLQKIEDPSMASRTQYWTRIEQISVSNWCCGHAIGLIQDGTCMVAKRPLRYLTDRKNFSDAISFDEVNNKIKSWKRIVQVAVSDSYFAIDADGKAYYAAVSRYQANDYCDVATWTNVKKIVPALQNGVLGINDEGKVLCAGANFIHGPHGNAQRKLGELNHVIDACVTGSEGEEVYVALEDGTVFEVFSGREINDFKAFTSKDDMKILDSTFNYTVFGLDSKRRLMRLKHQSANLPIVFSLKKLFHDSESLTSFAIKDGEVVAIL